MQRTLAVSGRAGRTFSFLVAVLQMFFKGFVVPVCLFGWQRRLFATRSRCRRRRNFPFFARPGHVRPRRPGTWRTGRRITLDGARFVIGPATEIGLRASLKARRSLAAFWAARVVRTAFSRFHPRWLRRIACTAFAGGAFRALRVEVVRVVDRDLFADHAFDRAQQTPLFRAHERVGGALGTGACRSADAVDVGFRFFGKIKVHDMRDAVHVDAARGDVRRHQHAHAAAAERMQRVGAGTLRLVAVDGVGTDVGGFQFAHNLVGAVTGAREDNDFPHFGARGQQVDQQAVFVRLVDKEHLLVDLVDRRLVRRDGDVDRIFDHRHGQAQDIGRKRRREKLRVALFGQFSENALDVGEEAHVQHAVRFVQHKLLDFIEREVPLFHQVHQASGGGHDERGAAAERFHLGVLADAAEDHGKRNAEKLAVGRNAVRDLRGKLACRGKDQRARTAADGRFQVCGEAVQDRQQERSRLSCSGLGAAQQIASFKQMGDRLLLDRRRGEIAFLGDRVLQKRVDQAENAGCEFAGQVTFWFWELARRFALGKAGMAVSATAERRAGTLTAPLIRVGMLHVCVVYTRFRGQSQDNGICVFGPFWAGPSVRL